ncbi:MAG TPA: NAD+ kinase [Rhodospirillaceae bacterium]|nr:NAD+ kinase [Rhodospirillaceae bacterium]
MDGLRYHAFAFCFVHKEKKDSLIMETVAQPGVWSAFVGFVGGLALFLYGMDMMSDGFKGAAGNNLRIWLARLTGNRLKAAGTGLVVTAMVQSSSVTTVLLVGFVSAGLMTLQQSLGVIIGADIGSTITTQLVAFNVHEIALLLVAIGFAMWFSARADRMRHAGAITMGIGLVFYGMSVMAGAMQPLQHSAWFMDVMGQMRHMGFAIVFSALFTAMVQSSAATMGVVVALASRGLISLETGIALSFGANIGTCITAVLAAIGKSREAWRTALGHVAFKVVGVLIWAGLIGVLAKIVLMVSPTNGTPSEVLPRQIANAHTLFNVLNLFVFIWFIKPAALFLKWLVPEKKGEVLSQVLEEDLLQAPALALAAAQREVGRLGQMVSEMVVGALPAILHGTRGDLDRLVMRDGDVDALYEAIVEYLRRIGRHELDAVQGRMLMRLMEAVGDFESIGDVVKLDLVAVGRHRLEENITVSTQTEALLKEVAQKVHDSVGFAIAAAGQGDQTAAQALLEMKGEMSRLGEHAREHGVKRLMSDDPNRFHTYSREMEVVDRLRRIYYFARKIALATLENTEEKPS